MGRAEQAMVENQAAWGEKGFTNLPGNTEGQCTFPLSRHRQQSRVNSLATTALQSFHQNTLCPLASKGRNWQWRRAGGRRQGFSRDPQTPLCVFMKCQQ